MAGKCEPNVSLRNGRESGPSDGLLRSLRIPLTVIRTVDETSGLNTPSSGILCVLLFFSSSSFSSHISCREVASMSIWSSSWLVVFKLACGFFTWSWPGVLQSWELQTEVRKRHHRVDFATKKMQSGAVMFETRMKCRTPMICSKMLELEMKCF